jgi:hypothetical protein
MLKSPEADDCAAWTGLTIVNTKHNNNPNINIFFDIFSGNKTLSSLFLLLISGCLALPTF